MDKIKVKITETRTTIVELDPINYPDGSRTPEGMIESEKESVLEFPEYMDMAGADSKVEFDVVG